MDTSRISQQSSIFFDLLTKLMYLRYHDPPHVLTSYCKHLFHNRLYYHREGLQKSQTNDSEAIHSNFIPLNLFIKSATQHIWSSPYFLETINMFSNGPIYHSILSSNLQKFQHFSAPNLHLSQRDRMCTGIWMDTSTPKTPWRPIPPR